MGLHALKVLVEDEDNQRQTISSSPFLLKAERAYTGCGRPAKAMQVIGRKD